ncbi:MogA/MoaB family molybdenum cofactor biosynthesis protein [Paenibacillus amylolyticus]|uniref:MogA/MoaB family molybdenum cofactor biosynthesis protein n=1 Tax=Paenibacillus amylolyticus TaxID=1451 RepID=UPI0039AFEA0D
MTNSVEQHRQEAPTTVSCMIVTVSDTRTKDTDTSGQLMHQLLDEAGYQIVEYIITPDETENIRSILQDAAVRDDIEAVLLSGGTGIAPRDTTYEAVSSLLDKELPGFGEIFRFLSYTEDIGSAAILSRAVAGTIGRTAVFSMPGSKGAVKLAMEKLILPELRHVMREIYKPV